jgi:hypothetical protein
MNCGCAATNRHPRIRNWNTHHVTLHHLAREGQAMRRAARRIDGGVVRGWPDCGRGAPTGAPGRGVHWPRRSAVLAGLRAGSVA